MAMVVSELGYEVKIIGRKQRHYCSSDSVPFGTTRFKMLFRKGFLFYAFFNMRLLFFLLFSKADVLVANDLDTLLPNYIVSKFKKIPVVYDSHEYFTGVPELNGRPFVKAFWKSIEKFVFPKLKNVITVSDSIADLYEKEYNNRPSVVRNCSGLLKDIIPSPREDLNIRKDSFVLILQGGGINIDKGAEELVHAVSTIDDVELLIAGSGDVIASLESIVRDLRIGERVHFLPAMPWKKLIGYTMMADAGMCLEKDTNINYRLSLPNKLFDYIAAGKPVIAGNLPEIEKIVVENNCGVIIRSITPEHIRNAVIELRDNTKLRSELTLNSARAALLLNWQNESETVKRIYNNLKPE